AREEKCERAGRSGRGGAGEERRGVQPAAPRQRAPHQLAAATVLISMVCNPLTMRCVPVTVTLPSACCSSFEFWGSPGLELTGRQIVQSRDRMPSGTPALAHACPQPLWGAPIGPLGV